MLEEKTVPIDTSGEALEVTLEEENVQKVEPQEAPVVEVEETIFYRLQKSPYFAYQPR